MLSFSTKKLVSLNGEDYTTNVTTTPNTEVFYKIALTSSEYNASTSFGTQIEFIDILPHIGDTGVILNEVSRLSEYSVSLANENFIGQIISGKTGEVTTTTDFTVEYSSSNNPIRFNDYGKYVIGTDEWDNPKDISLVRAIKVNTNLLLDSSDTFAIIFKVLVPTATTGETAYNSFGAKFYVYDSTTETTSSMLPTEPNKVGITMENTIDTREQAYIDLMQSIAMQEASIAYILEGEYAKMQKSLEFADTTALQQVNTSVAEMLTSITTLETLYLDFLEICK